MNKSLIFAAAALLLATGAGTGIRVALAPKGAPAAEAGTEPIQAGLSSGPGHPADPAHAAGSDAGSTPAHPAIESAAPAGDATAGAHAPAAGTAHDDVTPAEPAPDSAPPRGRPGAPVDGVEFQEMASILSGMGAEQAALFMQHVDDGTAVRILSAMSVRKAVEVLDCLPRQRAETIWARLAGNREKRP